MNHTNKSVAAKFDTLGRQDAYENIVANLYQY